MTEETKATPAKLTDQLRQQVTDAAQAKLDMQAQLMDYAVGVPEGGFTKPVTYVMTGDGVKYVRHTGMGDIVLPVTAVPNLPKLTDGLHLSIPKIPFFMICQCLAYFRAVHERDGGEASALVFFDPEKGEHFIHVPQQENNGGRSDFTMDEDTKRLRGEKVPVCELHSHHTMGAYFSATDDANENLAQTYMVFGTITTTPTYKCRFACAGVQKEIGLWEMVEKPQFTMNVVAGDAEQRFTLPVPDVLDKWPIVSFPAEWMEKAKKATAVVTYSTPTTGVTSSPHTGTGAGTGYGSGYSYNRQNNHGQSTGGVQIVDGKGVQAEPGWHVHPRLELPDEKKVDRHA